MTPIITDEVRAALERRKLFRYRLAIGMRHAEAINEVYAGSLGRPAIDNELIVDTMLALFPHGMPEPVEMWAGLSTDGTAVVGSAWYVPRETVPRRVRGVFIPIERLDAQP